jgi:hypothetical protein
LHGRSRRLSVSSSRALTAIGLCCALLAAAPLAHAAEPMRRAPDPFDVRTAQHFLGFGGARVFARSTEAQQYRPGFELRFVDALLWTRQWTTLGGATSIAFRALPGGYSFSLGQSSGFAGVHFGPVDLLAGVGLSLLNIDTLGIGWSASLGSPRTSAALGLSFESVRIELGAQLEYLWRWSGPDEYVRGVGVVLSLLQTPIGPTFSDPL